MVNVYLCETDPINSDVQQRGSEPCTKCAPFGLKEHTNAPNYRERHPVSQTFAYLTVQQGKGESHRTESSQYLCYWLRQWFLVGSSSIGLLRIYSIPKLNDSNRFRTRSEDQSDFRRLYNLLWSLFATNSAIGSYQLIATILAHSFRLFKQTPNPIRVSPTERPVPRLR